MCKVGLLHFVCNDEVVSFAFAGLGIASIITQNRKLQNFSALFNNSAL